MNSPHVSVTLPAAIVDRLLAESTTLGLPLEWMIAAFVAALTEEAGR